MINVTVGYGRKLGPNSTSYWSTRDSTRILIMIWVVHYYIVFFSYEYLFYIMRLI